MKTFTASVYWKKIKRILILLSFIDENRFCLIIYDYLVSLVVIHLHRRLVRGDVRFPYFYVNKIRTSSFHWFWRGWRASVSWPAGHSGSWLSWRPPAAFWWRRIASAGRPAGSGCTRRRSASAGASRWQWRCSAPPAAWNTKTRRGGTRSSDTGGHASAPSRLTLWRCPRTGRRSAVGGVWAPPGRRSLRSGPPSGTKSPPSRGCSCTPPTARRPERHRGDGSAARVCVSDTTDRKLPYVYI